MKIFQVGGSVRDEILGVEANDRDWVVVGSSPEKMVAEGFNLSEKISLSSCILNPRKICSCRN
jgi:tRNA nucleotidyltransferase/poly(A) polymerase